jgi:hypothetical protein
MADRITVRHLRARAEQINARLGRNAVDVSQAYGGYQITDGTGSRDLTPGHGPAREAYAFLQGMIATLDELLPRDQYGRVTTWDAEYRAVPRGADPDADDRSRCVCQSGQHVTSDGGCLNLTRHPSRKCADCRP